MANLTQTLTPTGELRVAINMGNPILVGRHPDTGAPAGISVDLATQLAQRLGVPMKLVVFDAASKSVEAVSQGEADVGFLPSIRCAVLLSLLPHPMC